MVLVEGFLWTPIVFLLMATPFRVHGPVPGGSRGGGGQHGLQVFWKVTFPMAMPSVLSVLILTFIRSLEAFEIPALVGLPAGIEVMTTQIYLELSEGVHTRVRQRQRLLRASHRSGGVVPASLLSRHPARAPVHHHYRQGFSTPTQGPGPVALAGRTGAVGPAGAATPAAGHPGLGELHALPDRAVVGGPLPVHPQQLRGGVQRRQDPALHHEQPHHQHRFRHCLRGCGGVRHRLAGDAHQHQAALESGSG